MGRTEVRSTWGLCAWFEELGTALIHPDDLDVVRALRPNGKVFRVVDADDAFLHRATETSCSAFDLPCFGRCRIMCGTWASRSCCSMADPQK